MNAMDLRIVRPATVEEALDIAREQGAAARFYAGGVDLVPMVLRRKIDVRTLIDVKRIPGSKSIEISDGALRIGMAVTYRDFGLSPLARQHLPTATAAMFSIGNPRVRSVGTIVGALARRDPDTDVAVLLGAHGAEIVEYGDGGEMRRAVRDWLDRPADGALITGVDVPLLGADLVSYHRFPRIGHPLAAVAARGEPGGRQLRLLVGCFGVAPVSLDVPRDIAPGGGVDRGLLDALVADAVRTGPISVETAEASSEYRRHLVAVLAARCISDVVTALHPNA